MQMCFHSRFDDSNSGFISSVFFSMTFNSMIYSSNELSPTHIYLHFIFPKFGLIIISNIDLTQLINL